MRVEAEDHDGDEDEVLEVLMQDHRPARLPDSIPQTAQDIKRPLQERVCHVHRSERAGARHFVADLFCELKRGPRHQHRW